MEFRTKISLSKERHLIDYASNILLIGSCFSESIFNKFDHFKFHAAKNPFGIVYNPKAIEKLILNAINKKVYSEDDIFYLNERWHCFDAHSELSHSNKKQFLQALNAQIEIASVGLKNASHIIFTLGTSWIYRFIDTDQIVANCHKVPQKRFLKELCSTDDLEESLRATIALVKSINPNTNILFTISPIRHLKDGFAENSLSKAHLRTAINQVIDQKENVSYFPSYEIMMDDLRDYRFYAEDMIHPNSTAIEYIWEKFRKAWLHDNTHPIMKQVDTIRKGLAHKPFNPNSEQHQTFLTQLNDKIAVLARDYSIHF